MRDSKDGNLQTVELNQNLNSSTGGLAYSVATFAYLAVAFVIQLVIVAAKANETEVAKYFNYLCAPIALCAVVLGIIKWKKISFKQIFPVKCGVKYYLIALMLIFGLLFSLGKISEPIAEFFKFIGYKPIVTQENLPNLSGGRVVLGLIVIALLPAVFEELLFRGLLLNCLDRSVGTIRTVFIIGFAFSLFHTSIEQTVYQFAAGCVFAFVALRSRSILPSIVMHFINNALIVIFVSCNLLDASGSLVLPYAADVALTVLGALSLVGGIVWLIFDKKEITRCTKGSVKSFFIFGAAGIAVLVIMWISTFIMRLM